MRIPLSGAPVVLRVVPTGYVVVFIFGALTFMARWLGVSFAAFIVAGVLGGLYGLVLVTNLEGGADYMAQRAQYRLQHPRGVFGTSPLMANVTAVRVFGGVIMVFCPVILISIALNARG